MTMLTQTGINASQTKNQICARHASVHSAYSKYLDVWSSVTAPAVAIPTPRRLGQVRGIKASAFIAAYLAEPFGVIQPEIIEKAIVASLCLDHFSHAVDDSTDETGHYERCGAIHVGTLMLARGMCIYSEIVPDNKHFWGIWGRFMEEASTAERYLWRHRGTLCSYRDVDFQMMGRKSALAKTNAALFGSLSEKLDLVKPMERAIENAAIAIQLIDDLFDLEQDLIARNFTYPLVYSASLSSDQSLDVIRATASSNRVACRVAKLACHYLNVAQLGFQELGAAEISSLVSAYHRGLTDFVTGIEGVPDGSQERDWGPMLRTFIDPQLSH